LSGLLDGQLSRRALLVRGSAAGGAALALSLLAACGGDDDKATATTGSASGGTTPTTAASTGGSPAAGGAATATTGSNAAPTTAPAAGEPKTGGTWTIVLGQEPDTLDAHKTGTYVAGVIHRYIGDTLIEKNPDDGTLQPALATKYEVSTDGLMTTFTLQDGILFHDGTPVDATAVKACYDRALNPDTKSAVTIGQMGPVDTIEASDAKTVVFKHKQSFGVFLDNMAHPVCSIINATVADADPDKYGRNPVCTGPWKFVSWEAANQVVVERNADYNWSPAFAHKGPAYIDKLVFRFFPEQATIAPAFEANEVDQIEIANAEIKRLKDTGKYETIEFYRPGATFMEFNVTKAPFDDIHVRKAFNYAVDHDALLEAGLEGYGRQLYSVLPQSIHGYWDGIADYAPKQDDAKAKEEFTAGGWTLDGDTLKKDGQPLSFTLSIISGTDSATNASQVMQAQLKKFGVDMQIQSIEFTSLLTSLKAGDYQASYIGYAYASPDIVYIWFHSKNIGQGLNLSHFNNPDLDALIDDSRSTIDDAKRAQDYQDIQKLIVDNAIWVPLWEASTTYGLQKRIQGHKIHPDGHLHLFEASLTDV
jgi:peptide/nickel transport system substrate-binding protein